ncbi:unnamed protein product [Spirodela intermedia]|uniref:Beta-amylase n=1 Tax=Spirodela intermedia TaxID=51605 RepID=A0A7I8I9L9_SPIIN|nr:unnamed protein product [Spirodela intermedia]CAA6654218.1 unnamed protein product [Spirodela intermedia]
MGKYDWSGYLALAQTIRDAGLQIRASLYFHIGEGNPDIFFTDRAGKRHNNYLSLAVDDLPVLEGKTPVEVYAGFLQSFRATFSDFLGSTIKDVLVGLGPDGELKYPSQQPAPRNKQVAGVGEFQGHREPFLGSLRSPRRPHYNESPESTNFFKEHGGSWDTPYGNFFLSWYSSQLVAHGDRILSVASAAFGDLPLIVYGKLPVMHAWYKHRRCEVFARHSCGMILPAMDLSDEHQPPASRSSPEALVAQIMRACEKHGVVVSGENSSLRGSPTSSSARSRRPSPRASRPRWVNSPTSGWGHISSPRALPHVHAVRQEPRLVRLAPRRLARRRRRDHPLDPSSAAEGTRQMQAV